MPTFLRSATRASLAAAIFLASCAKEASTPSTPAPAGLSTKNDDATVAMLDDRI